MNLRFIIRDGQKILQQQVVTGDTVDEYPPYDDVIKGGLYVITKHITKWVDVPLVEGEEE